MCWIVLSSLFPAVSLMFTTIKGRLVLDKSSFMMFTQGLNKSTTQRDEEQGQKVTHEESAPSIQYYIFID